MKTIKIRMSQNHSWGRKGSVIEVSEDVADRLVYNRFAEKIGEASEVVQPERKPVEQKKAKGLSNKSLNAAE